jgi:hypothetical protein
VRTVLLGLKNFIWITSILGVSLQLSLMKGTILVYELPNYVFNRDNKDENAYQFLTNLFNDIFEKDLDKKLVGSDIKPLIGDVLKMSGKVVFPDQIHANLKNIREALEKGLHFHIYKPTL